MSDDQDDALTRLMHENERHRLLLDEIKRLIDVDLNTSELSLLGTVRELIKRAIDE